MSRQQFLASPWRNSHGSYDGSPFNMRPAPEFATAEAVVASLYRALGFKDVAEGSVPAAGREFDRATQRPDHAERIGSSVSMDIWRTVLHGVLESPKQPNQSSRRFLQLCPMIPDIAIYSGSARLSANSWNPGQLVQRMVILGCATRAEAQALWQALFASMSVDESDDLWARWLQGEFTLRRKPSSQWLPRELEDAPNLPEGDKKALAYPARQFVKDLETVAVAKDSMTRRQWISLLEAVVRLGVVTHALWLCDVNARIWKAARAVLEGGDAPSEAKVREQLVTLRNPYLTYANPAVPGIRDQAARYLLARLGVNLLLWRLEEQGAAPSALASCAEVSRFLSRVSEHRAALVEADILDEYAMVADQEARVVACRKGIGSNIVEFCRHVLGQRQAANETLRGYDQGYVLRKNGRHASAPWVVSLGPVSVLALVHACLRESIGPRSVQRLCTHLAAYGLEVDRDDIASGDLGRQLRMLGLVLDSPDAETGMLLVPPFADSARHDTRMKR